MATFIGREKELATLDAAYASGETGLIPVYGRRRVGKSQLILEFIRRKPSLYFLGKQTSRRFQLRDFMRTAAQAFDRPALAEANPGDWRGALQLALEHRPAGKKFVLVLDEFQWIAESSEELPSLLQEMLDLEWNERGDMLLILCGSFIGFMEREVLGSKSPLFGRRTGQIFLKPLSYREAARFHPRWGLEDQAKAWFICGGVPFYHRFFKPERSLLANIEHNFLREDSALFAEADFLLHEELSEVRRYYAILTALGTGSLSGKDVEQATGIDERQLHYYFQKLEGLGYTSKRTPLTPRPKPRGKRARYVIDDALLTFVFRFVLPNTGFIAEMGAAEAFRSLVRPHLDAWFGARFEVLCRQALPAIYRREGVNVPFEIGEYWDSRLQIDVVGIRRGDAIDLCECKWGRIRSKPELRGEILRKAERYPAEHLTVQPRVFSRLPARREAGKDAVLWHSLEDFY